MLRLLLTLVLVASTSALDTSVAEVKRMIASMRTEEAAALEVQYHVHEAAGLHDQMVKINDKFFAAHAEAGTAREQALRKSFHEDGLYHTLFKVADTVTDYAFLETIFEHADADAGSGLDLSAVNPTDADVDKKSGLASLKSNIISPYAAAFVETKEEWGRAKRWAQEKARRAKAWAQEKARKAKEWAIKKAREAAALALRLWHAAVKLVKDGVLKVLKPIIKGAEVVKKTLKKATDLAGEVKAEIKSTAKKIKKTVVTIAGTMKSAASHIKKPFTQVVDKIKKGLVKALQDKSDCAKIKIKPTGVSMEKKTYSWCETILKRKKCLSIPYYLPEIKFEEKEFCNPSKAVKAVMENAFSKSKDLLQKSAKLAINEIIKSIGDSPSSGSGNNKISWKEIKKRQQQKQQQNNNKNARLCTGKADMFQHGDGNGWKASFKKGNYNHGQMTGKGMKNDDMSSMFVPAGCSVKIYQHGSFDGWKLSFGPGRYTHADLDRESKKQGVKNFNDQASSLKVMDEMGYLEDSTIMINGQHKCLDASERNKDGGKVHMWGCNSGNDNQKWVYNDKTGQIKSKHGKCLDHGRHYKNGGKIQMYRCDTGNVHENRQWTVTKLSDGKYRITPRQDKRFCFDGAHHQGDGGKVHLWTCTSQSTQANGEHANRKFVIQNIGSFLEVTEGQGNTAQLLAQINEQQGEGASKVTRSHLRASAMTTGGLDECSIGKADFAVWFRYGVSASVGTGAVGASLSGNVGIAFGCDGAGTAFMFPTIDVGLDFTAGVGVTGGGDHSLGIDIFANFDGLGQQGHSQESTWASGCGRDAHDCKCGPGGGGSVWGNKLGWGLGASLNVGDFGLGFSFTLPALKIGTTSILGIELPTSAAVDRPRLAGIGISGDASAIWTLLAGSPSGIIEPVVEGLADTMEISVSLGIGYVGIIGGKTTNWFAAPLKYKSDKGAKGASCNNLLDAFPPASIYECASGNVFQALPKSILTEWPFN